MFHIISVYDTIKRKIKFLHKMFQFDLPSAILKKRAEKFDKALLN